MADFIFIPRSIKMATTTATLLLCSFEIFVILLYHLENTYYQQYQIVV